MNRTPYDQFLKRDGPTNVGFYSFGGAKSIPMRLSALTIFSRLSSATMTAKSECLAEKW